MNDLRTLHFPLPTDRVPIGWELCTLSQFIESMQTGFASGQHNSDGQGVPHLRPMNVSADGKIDLSDGRFVDPRKNDLRLQRGDVLFNNTNSPAWVGKTALVDTDTELAFSNHMTRLRACAGIDSRFVAMQLHFFCRSGYFEHQCKKHVNQASINRDFLSELTPFCLPPVAEQQCIADKLDGLLSRVDGCRERLGRVPAILRRFRQSVLAAATSGKLTEEWRDEHADVVSFDERVAEDAIQIPSDYQRLTKQGFRLVPIHHDAGELPPTWSVLTIADLYNSNVLIDFADGNHGGLYPRKEEFGDEGVLFLTATQVGERWEVDLGRCPRLNSEKASQLVKGWANNGDVLLSHNATVGRVALLENCDEGVLLGTSLTFYRFNPEFIDPRFARIIFSSRFFQMQLESCMEQTTRNQVPITRQVSLHFLCPPIEEQREIIRRVDSLISFGDGLVDRIEKASSYVESLTPSLLAKAFRGELVPTEHELAEAEGRQFEDATTLLERIRQHKLTLEAEKKSSHKSRKPAGGKRMKKITPESLADAIQKLPEKPFTFDELRKHVSGSYDELKNAVFKLLERNEIGFSQHFDEKTKEMLFTRTTK